MSWEAHDDNCPGCRPAMMNAITGERLPDDSDEMIAVNRVWDGTTLQERRAWHRVTCNNSKMPSDLRLAGKLAERMSAAIREANR